jgi:hypothetical protein
VRRVQFDGATFGGLRPLRVARAELQHWADLAAKGVELSMPIREPRFAREDELLDALCIIALDEAEHR